MKTEEGRQREKTEWVKKRGGEKHAEERRERAQADGLSVCAVLTPINGKSLDDAPRPLQAKLW